MDPNPIVIVNPHQDPAAVEERKVREQNEDHARDNHVQHDVRLALRDLAPKIREMKKLRDQPGQPGWANSNNGIELERAKGLATVLCISRARHKDKWHPVILPHVLHLPPAPGKRGATVHCVRELVELKRLVDATIAERFPKEESPPATPAAEQAA